MIWLQSTLVIFDQCKDKDDQAVQTDLEMEANEEPLHLHFGPTKD